jgi:hypothetical protein
MTDVAVDLLRELVAEVRAQRHELREMNRHLAARQPARLSRVDERALLMLLPIIGRHVGERVFSVHELVAHARLPGEVELREAIAAVGGANACGRLLKRGADVIVGDWHVEHVGDDRDGNLFVARAGRTSSR